MATDTVHATTWPTFNVHEVGKATRPQLPEAPPLGEVFCANVFGHYMLLHQLAPLLHHRGPRPGRVIWQGSISAYASGFSVSDIQGLRAADPYDSSKRLTDLLVLTAGLPSVRREVRGLLSLSGDTSGEKKGESKVEMYLAHPGICGTSIMPLPWYFLPFLTLPLYFARWLGSIWHPISAYKGAVSAVWLALAASAVLDTMTAQGGGAGKWGSATDRFGDERVERTDVEGWGVSGIVGGKAGVGGRRRGHGDVDAEKREEFEVLAGECWREMEILRKEWEKRLEAAEK